VINLIVFVLITMGQVLIGSICLFRTNMVVDWERKTLFLQAFPALVLKPWYPIVVRFMGTLILLWAVAFDWLVLTHRVCLASRN
jgi:hypothetical protein